MDKYVKIAGVLLIFLAGLAMALLPLRRPARVNLQEELFQGVVYTRTVRLSPRPSVIHIVTIDASQAGIAYLVTPGEIGQVREYRAQTTSDFAQKYRVQVAINGGFFKPFYSHGPFFYYPHKGDWVDVNGLSIAQGVSYSAPQAGRTTLCIDHERAVIVTDTCDAQTQHAISGKELLVRNGQIEVEPVEAGESSVHPRTTVGIDATGQKLWLVVIDGRQPGYSDGMTLYEAAQLMVELGVDDGLNLDGGGSSTLVVRREDAPEILNAPYHTRVWMRERPVANHLGVYVREAQALRNK